MKATKMAFGISKYCFVRFWPPIFVAKATPSLNSLPHCSSNNSIGAFSQQRMVRMQFAIFCAIYFGPKVAILHALVVLISSYEVILQILDQPYPKHIF